MEWTNRKGAKVSYVVAVRSLTEVASLSMWLDGLPWTHSGAKMVHFDGLIRSPEHTSLMEEPISSTPAIALRRVESMTTARSARMQRHKWVRAHPLASTASYMGPTFEHQTQWVGVVVYTPEFGVQETNVFD